MTQSLLSVLPDDKMHTHPLPAAAAGWPGAHTKSSAALSPGMAEAPAAESSADGPCSSCQEPPLSCLLWRLEKCDGKIPPLSFHVRVLSLQHGSSQADTHDWKGVL